MDAVRHGAARKRGGYGFETARVFLRDCRKGTDQQSGGSPAHFAASVEYAPEGTREGKAWQVTPEGEALYQRAQFILSYVAGLEKDIRESRNKVSGLVRIGVCPPCLSLASTPIPALNREFPDLRFRVWVMDNQSLERHMQERNLDFALVQLPVQNANYAMLPLARQEFVAVYGQGVPPPEARSIGVEELREAPLMLSRRRDGGGGYDLIMRAFQDKGVRPNVVLDSQDTRLLHKLLRQGMSAVAILPEREVAAGTLESFPMRRLDVPGLDLAPVLIWLEHAYLSRTARRVIQCLHKVNADPGEQPDFEI